MADQHIIEDHLEGILSGTDIFLVGVKVDRNNRIVVHLDRAEGISIDDCVRVSRELKERLDREKEDFSLEVSSPGLDAPFRVMEQYRKNLGKEISVIRSDGSKLEGILKKIDEKGISLDVIPRRKAQSKDPQIIELAFEDIQSARVSFRL